MADTRSYNSPLREKKAGETREAILRSLYRLMSASIGPDEISMDHRCWDWYPEANRLPPLSDEGRLADRLLALVERVDRRIDSTHSVKDIVNGPQDTFPRFDAHEGAIRASLHSPTGRAMRSGIVPGRRLRFARAIAPVLENLPSAEARKVEALAHLLYSAAAWEVLKDYGGLDGAQAGETASWALETVLSAVASGSLPRTWHRTPRRQW
jgi:hypothetical protein